LRPFSFTGRRRRRRLGPAGKAVSTANCCRTDTQRERERERERERVCVRERESKRERAVRSNGEAKTIRCKVGSFVLSLSLFPSRLESSANEYEPSHYYSERKRKRKSETDSFLLSF
jgi:hypothetical protein